MYPYLPYLPHVCVPSPVRLGVLMRTLEPGDPSKLTSTSMAMRRWPEPRPRAPRAQDAQPKSKRKSKWNTTEKQKTGWWLGHPSEKY